MHRIGGESLASSLAREPSLPDTNTASFQQTAGDAETSLSSKFIQSFNDLRDVSLHRILQTVFGGMSFYAEH